jgi:carbon-monoxide dehydrogenase medium subunit
VHVLVDLSGIAELGDIREEEGELVVGAMAPVASIADDQRVRGSWGLLAAACERMGDEDVRRAATLGGNLAARVPGPFDLAAVALAFEARLLVESPAGSRAVAVERLADPTFALAPDELLVAVRFAPGHAAWHHSRETTNASYPVVALAVQVAHSGPRAAAAVGLHHPLRLSLLERLLASESSERDATAAANDVLAKLPAADDAIASGRYRRRLLGVLVQDALREIWE